jgi:hypothetical protein
MQTVHADLQAVKRAANALAAAVEGAGVDHRRANVLVTAHVEA